MKIKIDDYKNLKNKEPLTLTIGNFDGLHLGHQSLINTCLSYDDTKCGLLSFYPHPMKVLRDVKFETLMSLDQKLDVLKKTKLDQVYIVNFDQAFSNVTKDEFISFLKNLNVKRVVVGKDFRFGAFAKGSVSDLEKHFKTVIVNDILKDHTRISTSYIKDLIKAGNLSDAKDLLSRDYQIEGLVIDGDKVGRTLGIPTANLDVDDYILPPNGVYYTEVYYEDNVYAGALNIGYNPTVNYSKTKRTEVHILDFNETIYGKKLKLVFKVYLRPELKFETREELIKTMEADLDHCRKLFKNK